MKNIYKKGGVNMKKTIFVYITFVLAIVTTSLLFVNDKEKVKGYEETDNYIEINSRNNIEKYIQEIQTEALNLFGYYDKVDQDYMVDFAI